LDPSPSVLQVATLLNYNRLQHNIPKLCNSEVYARMNSDFVESNLFEEQPNIASSLSSSSSSSSSLLISSQQPPLKKQRLSDLHLYDKPPALHELRSYSLDSDPSFSVEEYLQ